MELARTLPASDRAADLARGAVDLAVGARLPSPVADDLKVLALSVLTEAAALARTDRVELRVVVEDRLVRVEVRGVGEFEPVVPASGPAPHQEDATLADVCRLADRWGVSHHEDRHCVWAEKFTAPDGGRPPSPRLIPAA